MMKNLISRSRLMAYSLSTLMMFTLVASFQLFAQTGPDPILPETISNVPSLENLLTWSNLLWVAVFNIVGFLSPYIPGINRIPKTAWKVFVISLVVIGTVLSLGFADSMNLVFSYLLSTQAYALVLSLFRKTDPKEPVPSV